MTLSSIPCEKNWKTCSGGGAGQPRHLLDHVPVALAHARLDHRVRAGGVGLHLEQQRGPVAEQVDVRPAHRLQHLGLRDAARGGPERAEDALVRDVVAGDEQLALGLEQPEQVRLRDAGLARDRVGRGAAVAAERELPIASATISSRRSSADLRVRVASGAFIARIR